jgi:hypothetical protein
MTGSLEVSVGSRAGAPSSQACVPRAQAARNQHRANACMHGGFLNLTQSFGGRLTAIAMVTMVIGYLV